MNSPEPSQTALIIGAGAVENAWQPIIDTLQPFYPHKMDGDAAYCVLARTVYLMRYYATSVFPGVEQTKKEAVDWLNNLKSEIARNLRLAQTAGTIKPRKELAAILEKFIFSNIHKSVLISANWDTVIDREVNKLSQCNYPTPGSNVKTLHIHGSIDEPGGIYLPSEVVREPYRTKEEDTKMGTLHGTMWRTLEQCDTTVLYGLSLDPLDAELSQTLTAGWCSPKIKRIFIIDPNHSKIANRVKFLIDTRYPAEIIGYHPANLEAPFSY